MAEYINPNAKKVAVNDVILTHEQAYKILIKRTKGQRMFRHNWMLEYSEYRNRHTTLFKHGKPKRLRKKR